MHMYVYMYIYICFFLYTYIYERVHAHTHIYVYILTHAYIHTYIYTYICVGFLAKELKIMYILCIFMYIALLSTSTTPYILYIFPLNTACIAYKYMLKSALLTYFSRCNAGILMNMLLKYLYTSIYLILRPTF